MTDISQLPTFVVQRLNHSESEINPDLSFNSLHGKILGFSLLLPWECLPEENSSYSQSMLCGRHQEWLNESFTSATARNSDEN